MRTGTVQLAVVISFMAATGCVVRGGTAPPPQQAPPPPTAYTHPGFTYYGQPAAPRPQAPIMPPALSIADLVNFQHLRSLAAQPPRCNLPIEVAPNVFIHLDCFPYKRVAIARKHASPLKLNLMNLGQLRWNPFAVLQGPRGIAPGAVGAQENQPYPDLVDHRLSGTEGPIKDQGDVGACTAFALSAVMDNSLRRAKQNITTSPEHLWAHYGVPTMEDAASSNMNKGITTFEALPYSGREACQLVRDPSDDCGLAYNVQPNSAASNASLQQRLRVADASNGHRPIAFEELEVSPPNINELVATLASGADLWVAFNIDSTSWTNRRIVNGVIPDWSFANGGHAVAMSGYRRVNGSYQFLIHNSWGASWGDKGYAWVSQAMVQRWLHLAYKVRTDVDSDTPITPKSDEDCPGDQVMDTVTQRCAGICPDQSRPANGQCPNGPAPGPSPLPLPNLGGWPTIPGIPPIPGWPQPNQPNNQPTPPNPNTPQTPTWPWPVPSNFPNFFPPPPK